MDKIIFNLKRHWLNPANYRTGETSKIVDLYEEIKAGRKTSEWRNFSSYWQRRLLLCSGLKALSKKPIDCTEDLKASKAWFVVGYPKNNLPRLETDIVELIYHPKSEQFEIKFANVQEVVA